MAWEEAPPLFQQPSQIGTRLLSVVSFHVFHPPTGEKEKKSSTSTSSSTGASTDSREREVAFRFNTAVVSAVWVQGTAEQLLLLLQQQQQR